MKNNKTIRIIVLPQNGGGLTEEQMCRYMKVIPKEVYGGNEAVLLSGIEYSDPKYLLDFLQDEDVIALIVGDHSDFFCGKEHIRNIKRFLKIQEGSSHNAVSAYGSLFTKKVNN